jgi:hypothetical protein
MSFFTKIMQCLKSNPGCIELLSGWLISASLTTTAPTADGLRGGFLALLLIQIQSDTDLFSLTRIIVKNIYTEVTFLG